MGTGESLDETHFVTFPLLNQEKKERQKLPMMKSCFFFITSTLIWSRS